MQNVGRVVPFAVRMPDALKARIKEIAASNRRSMNSEIVILLERAVFDPLGPENGKGAASA